MVCVECFHCDVVIAFFVCCVYFFFFQAEDGIRYLVRSRGLGDVYKRQVVDGQPMTQAAFIEKYCAGKADNATCMTVLAAKRQDSTRGKEKVKW